MKTAEREHHIERLRRFPDELEALVSGLDEARLRGHFLAGEWSVAQNVHHLADSHLNSFIRLKLLLTEEEPTIKPYDQDAWAVTADYDLSITVSLGFLRALHTRWTALFASLSEEQWGRACLHPVNGRMTAEDLLTGYSAHCDGHIDQIQRTLAAAG